jgi:hypothetical protein
VDDKNAKKMKLNVWNRTESYWKNCGPSSLVGVATDYGLDGPGIESVPFM